MQKWIEYIHSANPDLIWRKRANNNFGDWLNTGSDTPREVLATAYFAYSTRLLSKMAQAIGKTRRCRTVRRPVSADQSRLQSGVCRRRTDVSRAIRRPRMCWPCASTCCPRKNATLAAKLSGGRHPEQAQRASLDRLSRRRLSHAHADRRRAIWTWRTACSTTTPIPRGAIPSGTARRPSGSAGTAGRRKKAFRTPA